MQTQSSLVGKSCFYRFHGAIRTNSNVITSVREVENLAGAVFCLALLDNDVEVPVDELYFLRSSTAELKSEMA